MIDASAVLAILLRETGSERAEQAVREGAIMSAVNFSEVIARKLRRGDELEAALEEVGLLEIEVFDFDSADAQTTAVLLASTRARGLSLGDRACLALAMRLGLPAMTADRGWANLDVGVQIEVCR